MEKICVQAFKVSYIFSIFLQYRFFFDQVYFYIYINLYL